MRERVPFGKWLMAIDHPYSLGVMDGGSFWSCGQCPLDRSARTMFPGDLAAQVRFTMDLIGEEFASVGVSRETIAKLVVYFGEAGRPALDAAHGAARLALGGRALVVPIGVPHFYYDGMLTEIDVHAGIEPIGPPVKGSLGQARWEAVRCGPLVHAVVTVEGITGPEALALLGSRGLEGALGAALPACGAGLDGLLSARVFVAEGKEGEVFDLELSGTRLCPDPGAAIRAGLPGAIALTADLVFAAGDFAGGRSRVSRSASQTEAGVCLVVSAAGPYLCLQGRLGAVAARSMSLPDQTRTIMEAFRAMIGERGFTFADVVKQQAHYIGSASAEDLYSNMRVRNGYYVRPGPASTGLPVHGFVADGPAIAIELMLSRP